MTKIADHDEAQASSSSAVNFIEEAFRSLNLTPAEAQNVIRAFVEVVNRTTSPTSTPASSSHSTNSADSTRVGVDSTRDEDVISDDEAPVDEGSVPALVPVLFTTCSYHGNCLATGSAGSTATSTTAVSPTPSATIIASVPSVVSVPSVASGAPTLPATPGVVNAPTAAPVAVPLYAALPPNPPSNAILPPTHLVMAPCGYHIPAANADGPFYVVTCGRNLGIFSGWETVSPLVTGVSHAVYSRVSSVAEGHARINAANIASFALYLT
ncbi:uncharacterized protein LACBIDRAFT_299143 [Laccaria bicolor S238N-H82]|uniref:Predicted protein n=1 Tax=Laccaria bicolor (strain S238N-H82 / ATCC MYA-4686) TaxID=486041 RepID=B0DE61_LACBS|nr:uncharacterized protein LACBIDRAFT_299143 [Laccaria bicolor S238N-H82]EDR07207.1 predicted protein [Laccaria bicolor S238N-H82]|eukprot:XP_001882138.1 predicted protein [Laccaria bicolor S238N-H82]